MAQSSALSGGVAGKVSILSSIGGHTGREGVRGVSRQPLLNVAMMSFAEKFRPVLGLVVSVVGTCNLYQFPSRDSDIDVDTCALVELRHGYGKAGEQWANPKVSARSSEIFQNASRDHDAMDLA